MSNLVIPEISRVEHGKVSWLAGGEYIELAAGDQGNLDIVLRRSTRLLLINNVFVEPEFRRNGIGKALLREAIMVAQETGTELITAGIVSRESLDACRAVFGEGAVEVQEEGVYETESRSGVGLTRAALWYELGQEA